MRRARAILFATTRPRDGAKYSSRQLMSRPAAPKNRWRLTITIGLQISSGFLFFHEYAASVAAKHARRLLDFRSLHKKSSKARRRRASVHTNVREIFSRWKQSRVRAREQYLRGGRCQRHDHADHPRWLGEDHQRHI